MLHNQSKYAISSFQSYKDGKWSAWSNVSLAPGETGQTNWNSDNDDCVVPFRIICKDVETEQYNVDWCKVGNIRVHDDGVATD